MAQSFLKSRSHRTAKSRLESNRLQTAQPDADGIIFDPASGRVLVASGEKCVLMTLKPDIDPKTGKLDPLIELGGKPEFLAADGKGNAYINLVDKNEVVAVDLKARK